MIEFVLHADPSVRLEPEAAAELAATMEAGAVERQIVRSLLITVQWPSRTCPPSVFNENAEISTAILQLLRHRDEWTGKGSAAKPVLPTIGWMVRD